MRTRSNILPLDIHQISFDLRGLAPEACGAYLKLLTHYWQFGAMPNDLRYLAGIAGLRGDAPSILKTCLARLFYLESDGRLHSRQWGGRFRMEDDKAKKRQEKARHAANVRWERYDGRKGIKIERNETTVTYSEHSEPENSPPPSASPSLSPTPPLTTPSLSPTGGAGSPMPPPVVPGGASDCENKAKPPETPLRAMRRRRYEGNHADDGARGVAGIARGRARHYIDGSDPENHQAAEDWRFEPFRELIVRYWSRVNTIHKICPWAPADRRALRHLLEMNPMLTVDLFKRCLDNRALSKVNHAALPQDWLRKVVMFIEGPLNEFSKPMRFTPAAALAIPGVYHEPATIEEADAQEKRSILNYWRNYEGSRLAGEVRAELEPQWKPEWGRAPWEVEP